MWRHVNYDEVNFQYVVFRKIALCNPMLKDLLIPAIFVRLDKLLSLFVGDLHIKLNSTDFSFDLLFFKHYIPLAVATNILQQFRVKSVNMKTNDDLWGA